jgi:hypothetical protein
VTALYRRHCRRASICLCALFVLAASTALGDYVVDQSNDDDPPNSWVWSITGMGPMGQEFTPALGGINVTEIHVSTGVGNNTLQVVLRDATITGAVLGVSGAETPGPSNGYLRFDFPELVELTPGELYVLELVSLEGGGSVSVGSGYPGGRAIRLGEPSESADLLFREGISSITPVSSESWGRIKSLYR